MSTHIHCRVSGWSVMVLFAPSEQPTLVFFCACSVTSHSLQPPWTVACLPGSSVHGIFQARLLEWVAISLSRGPS